MVQRGLLPKAVKISERASAWPSDEIDAINRARIAGKSEDEIRQLVTDLERQRCEA
jgi:prophage regulatory protein